MYTIPEIANITGGKVIGNGFGHICKLSADSRAISFPEKTLFIAVKTCKNDGHKYIDCTYKKGVRSFVVSDSNIDFSKYKDSNFIVVDNSMDALQKLAAHHRNRFNLPVIGVTGSNGKTIVKEWLFQLLSKDFKITRSPRSYNSQIGVPFSVWEMNADSQISIFEAGISQPEEMSKLAPIINPTIGIFTNLGEAHQENFSSLKQKCNEKLLLFKNCDILIYNKDNKLVDISVMQSGFKAKLLTFGRCSEADIQILSTDKDAGRTTVKYLHKSVYHEFEIPFTDDASVENSLLCLAVMLHLNVSQKDINERMALLEPVAMRLELKKGLNGCTLINDSYNSDFNSLNIALDYLKQLANVSGGKITVILSDIHQSGENSEILYKRVQSLLVNKNIDRFIGVGREISKFQNLKFADDSAFFKNTADFLSHMDELNFRNETILLKGSRDFQFEAISDKLSECVHETALEVNLSALVRNFNYFRSFLKPGTKIMSMVKAYAYGSGDIEVARTLQMNGCDYLAVAIADEGEVLRKEGIHMPIVVMNPEKNSFRKIFENNLEPEIYSFNMLDLVMNEAKNLGITEYPIHIKIDTGMHRLGFNPDEIDMLIKKLKTQNFVMPRSVFSHLVGADNAKFDEFTRQQLALFETAKSKVQNAFSHKVMAHILNSAGIERFSDFQHDMVRLGIGHYGISATPDQKLEEVCALKTNILQIKHVPANETVGYSRKGVLKRDSVIGAIPIGYADGLDRHLGNGVGWVLVNGKRAPIVGNVCMDVCMIDLTDINAKEGDEVTIFGDGLSINEVAQWLGTIPYEVLTSISRRVKRIYYKE